jgi:hypothetical protein
VVSCSSRPGTSTPWWSPLNNSSQCNFKDVATALRNQFPESWGLRIRNVNANTKYFEISFRSDAAREAALKKDFSYEGKKVIVSRTYPKDTTILRVSVSNLPFDDEEELKAQMSTTFAKYGSILEMGLLHTVHGHFFTGRGFVTLNLVPGKEYAPLVPQIDSWEAGETLKITYTGMKPICSRCHVTDHVFGNCPVMRQRAKLCHICNSPEHLQNACPKAWWNERKKSAKMSMAHTSPHQQKPLVKATALIVPPPVVTVENTPVTEKDTQPFITEIVPASVTESPVPDSTNQESSSEVPVATPSGDEDGRDDTVLGEEQQANVVVVADSEQSSSVAAHEQQGDIPEDESDGDMDDDDDNADINMADAEKEAAASSLPLQEVLQKMKRQLRIQRRKAKQMHRDNKDKDKPTRSRLGGLTSKKKASTKPSSRQ